MQSIPQVHAAAEVACMQRPNKRPIATTSSITTYDAEMRVWAYCRSSSVSKAGRVPDVDVNRSRASRTRCAAARRLLTGGAKGVSAGSWTTSGFSAGLLIKQHKSCPLNARTFGIVYLSLQIIKRGLKERENLVNGELN